MTFDDDKLLKDDVSPVEDLSEEAIQRDLEEIQKKVSEICKSGDKARVDQLKQSLRNQE